ncbi:MAG: PAS domain S-box protein, partial [Acholeplasmatales bacterium]
MNLDRYLAWFDHVEIGVYFVDCDRKIRYFNQAAETITGFLAHDVTGTHCQDNLFNHVSEAGV